MSNASDRGRKRLEMIRRQDEKRAMWERSGRPVGKKIDQGQDDGVRSSSIVRDPVPSESGPSGDNYWRQRFDSIVQECRVLRDGNPHNTMVSNYIMDVIATATDSIWTYRDVVLAVNSALDSIQGSAHQIRTIRSMVKTEEKLP